MSMVMSTSRKVLRGMFSSSESDQFENLLDGFEQKVPAVMNNLLTAPVSDLDIK